MRLDGREIVCNETQQTANAAKCCRRSVASRRRFEVHGWALQRPTASIRLFEDGGEAGEGILHDAFGDGFEAPPVACGEFMVIEVGLLEHR